MKKKHVSTHACSQLQQAGKEQATLESKLAAAQFSKPAIVPLSQVCLHSVSRNMCQQTPSCM